MQEAFAASSAATGGVDDDDGRGVVDDDEIRMGGCGEDGHDDDVVVAADADGVVVAMNGDTAADDDHQRRPAPTVQQACVLAEDRSGNDAAIDDGTSDGPVARPPASAAAVTTTTSEPPPKKQRLSGGGEDVPGRRRDGPAEDKRPEQKQQQPLLEGNAAGASEEMATTAKGVTTGATGGTEVEGRSDIDDPTAAAAKNDDAEAPSPVGLRLRSAGADAVVRNDPRTASSAAEEGRGDIDVGGVAASPGDGMGDQKDDHGATQEDYVTPHDGCNNDLDLDASLKDERTSLGNTCQDQSVRGSTEPSDTATLPGYPNNDSNATADASQDEPILTNGRGDNGTVENGTVVTATMGESFETSHTNDREAKGQLPAVAPKQPCESNENAGETEATSRAGLADAAAPVAKIAKKHIRSKGLDRRVLEIRRRIQHGCKCNDLASAMAAYDEANSQGIRLEAQSFYSLLNLCDGLDRGLHIGTPKAHQDSEHSGETQDVHHARSIDWRKRQECAFRIKDHMEQQNLALNETAYSAIVKILCRNKEFDKAQSVLDEAERVQQCKPKLRLYSSLFVAYCREGRMVDALRCWKRLKGQPGLDLTEREYFFLMRCATSTGDSLVMQQVLTNLADEVPIPSKDAVAAIIEWFEIKHSNHTESLTRRQADDAEVRQLLKEINSSSNQIGISEPPPVMGPVVDTNGWTISSACHVDPANGVLMEGCLAGHQMQPVHISDRAFHQMVQMNESIVLEGNVDGNNCEFQGGRKGRKRTNFSPEARQKEWKALSDILDTKMIGDSSRRAIEVVIDGANVGYYKQNFSNAPRHVDYEQIDWVVRKFNFEKKQRVLLVMHARHFSVGLMPPKFKHLCDAWEEEGILFKTPPGMNDDWFWMHAALKYKTLVVTNDEMRDHHFQMLAPRFFLRWKERHQVHFDFGAWENTASVVNDDEVHGNGNCRQREVLLTYPDAYSRKIQRVANGLVVPLAKRGDENRFLDGCHVASEDEPLQQTYLCIRPKATSEDSTLMSNVDL